MYEGIYLILYVCMCVGDGGGPCSEEYTGGGPRREWLWLLLRHRKEREKTKEEDSLVFAYRAMRGGASRWCYHDHFSCREHGCAGTVGQC